MVTFAWLGCNCCLLCVSKRREILGPFFFCVYFLFLYICDNLVIFVPVFFFFFKFIETYMGYVDLVCLGYIYIYSFLTSFLCRKGTCLPTLNLFLLYMYNVCVSEVILRVGHWELLVDNMELRVVCLSGRVGLQ